MRVASLSREQMYGSSRDCNGLQPAQHLLKSLSREGTDLQYCDWLSSSCNDVIHSEQGLYLYEAHSARHVPEKEWKKKRIIKMAINCIERADNDSCRHDKWMQGTGLIWLICHLLLSRISTETLRRGSAESTDSSWTQDEDIWAMLTESTMNCVNTHKKSQKKL